MTAIQREQIDRLIEGWIVKWTQAGVFERLRVRPPESFNEMDEVQFALAAAVEDAPDALVDFPRGRALAERVRRVLHLDYQEGATDADLQALAVDALRSMHAVTGEPFSGTPEVIASSRPLESLVAIKLAEWMDANVERLPIEYQAALIFLDEQLYSLRDSHELAGWVAWVYFEELATTDPWTPILRLYQSRAKLILIDQRPAVVRVT